MKRKWKTRDGTKVWIKDMTNAHILNTLGFIMRRSQAQRLYYLEESMLIADSLQGEMATYYADQEVDSFLESDWTDFVPEEYEAILAEAEKRGISDLERFYGVAE